MVIITQEQCIQLEIFWILANYIREPHQYEDKLVKLPGKTNRGWVLRKEIESEDCPYYLKGKHGNRNTEDFQRSKGGSYLNHALIQGRIKKLPSKQLEVWEQQVYRNSKDQLVPAGKPVKRKRTAYRLKRDASTWTSVYQEFSKAMSLVTSASNPFVNLFETTYTIDLLREGKLDIVYHYGHTWGIKTPRENQTKERCNLLNLIIATHDIFIHYLAHPKETRKAIQWAKTEVRPEESYNIIRTFSQAYYLQRYVVRKATKYVNKDTSPLWLSPLFELETLSNTAHKNIQPLIKRIIQENIQKETTMQHRTKQFNSDWWGSNEHSWREYVHG